MAISTDNSRIDQTKLIVGADFTEYERNPNGEIRYAGQNESNARLSVNLTRRVFDRTQLRKVIDRNISELATEKSEETTKTEISN